MPKIIYSALYEEYLVIYTNSATRKTTIEHCGVEQQNAKSFADSLVASSPMWYENM